MNSGTIPKKRIGVDPIKSCDCECRCGCEDAASSSEPVRLFNGQKEFSVTDLSSGGLGAVWGHTRQYNNRLKDGDTPVSFDLGQGYNWMVIHWPYVYENDSDGSYQVVRGSEDAFFFEPIGGGEFSPWFGIHQKLEHDTAAGRLRMTDPDGHVWEMNDFESLEAPGLFRKMTTPGGQTVEVTVYNEGKIATVERSGAGQPALEQYQYDYLTGGDGESRLETVTLRRRPDDVSPWQDVRRVVYTYYADSDDHGSEGDLQTAVHEAWIGGTWTATATHYYRYWKDSEGNGFQHALKYAVGPEAYQRLEQAVGDPLLATDSVVAQYADLYLEYDAEQQVTKEIVAGGSRAYLFTFDDRPGTYSHGYNNWVRETSESRPDGTQNIVFTNHLGQVLLRELTDGSGNRWIEHWQYDEEEAHTVLHAHPSSIDSYTFDTAGELSVTLKANEGLIEVTDYYTTTGSGAAEGRVQHEKIKQGESGTEIKLRSYEYTSHSEGERTVHLVSKETIYRNEDGSGAVNTTYNYSWHSGTVQLEERITTLPAIPVSQNGSGVSNTRTERFDDEGNLTWSMDERGFIHRNQYNPATGTLLQTIQDVDTTQVTGAPTGWSTPSGGGKHVISDYEHDDLGRITQELGPEHEVDIDGTATDVRTATWTVYDDKDHKVQSAQGYATGTNWDTFTLVNPVSITKLDRAGRAIEEIQATRASSSGKLSESDTFAQSSYVRWSSNSYDDEGRLEHSRVYHTIPSSGAGSSGTNYDQTDYGYDSMARQNMVKSPGGTITRTVFSAVGWDSVPTAVYIGTNDTAATQSDPTGEGDPNNMVLVTEYEYDNANDGGDGLLTKQTQHVDALTSRETSFTYDWRNRQTDIDGEEDFYRVSVFDNLDRVTRLDRHDTTSSGNLIARSETVYDDLGRVYQTKRYAVDVSTGTVGNSLTDNTWYDESGNVIKEHPTGSQAFTKYEYDSLGRQVKQFIGFDVDESSHAEAFNVTGDTIFEQSETDYDDANNVMETRLRRRHHDATGTGELTTPSGSNPKARVSYVAYYSDAVGRQIAVANYGTNDDVPLSRTSTVPTRSDDILVTTTEYNDAGEPYKTIDPADKEDRTEFDDAGRVTKQVENYTDGDPTTGGNDEDITVCFTYTPDGQQATITAKQKSPSDDQTTKYIYGTSLSDSDIARTDLLRAVIYPDSDDSGIGVPPVFTNGPDGIYDRVEHKYNRQGEVTETKDQNETVHAFDHDKLGRQIHDRVLALGPDIDGAVRRISTTYEVRGQLEKITSYDKATIGSGSVVNELKRQYNNFSQLTTEYQDHRAAVNTSTSPKVQYAYTDGSNNHIRRTKMTYPDGRILRYEYSSGDDDNLSRVSFLADDDNGSVGTHLAEYSYLGLSGCVQVDYTEPDIRMDLGHGSGNDPYDGLDDFDRVGDLLWRDYGGSSDVVRIKHGYDRAGNRLYREDPVAAANSKDFDELYSYDGVNRLTSMKRGDLTASKDGIASGTLAFEQDWSLDPLGNWSSFKEDSDGDASWELNQSRSHNKVNELTDIDSSSSHVAHDRNGNMTKVPKPDNWSAHFDLIWDAWNRLVKVDDGAATIAEYTYDGIMRRVTKDADSTVRHFYYTASWQAIEERLDSSTEADRQYVWGLRYIDDLIVRDRDTSDPSNGTLNERIYTLQDGNWNVVCLVDTTGDPIERVTYSCYGNAEILDGSFDLLSSTVVEWAHRFATRPEDDSTGLREYRARNYHAQGGFFTTRDSIILFLGGRYTYVFNNPVTFVDPTGLQPKPAFGNIPPCPCSVKSLRALKRVETQEDPHASVKENHSGADRCFRIWKSSPDLTAGNQCCYDKNECLITKGSGAGTPDLYAPTSLEALRLHYHKDYLPFKKLVDKHGLAEGVFRYHRAGWCPISDPECPENNGLGGTRLQAAKSSETLRLIRSTAMKYCVQYCTEEVISEFSALTPEDEEAFDACLSDCMDKELENIASIAGKTQTVERPPLDCR